MAERKSKPRKKKEEDEEPTGWRRIAGSPWYLLTMWVLAIATVVSLLFGVSNWLSQGGFPLTFFIVGGAGAVVFILLLWLSTLGK